MAEHFVRRVELAYATGRLSGGIQIRVVRADQHAVRRLDHVQAGPRADLEQLVQVNPLLSTGRARLVGLGCAGRSARAWHLLGHTDGPASTICPALRPLTISALSALVMPTCTVTSRRLAPSWTSTVVRAPVLWTALFGTTSTSCFAPRLTVAWTCVPILGD